MPCKDQEFSACPTPSFLYKSPEILIFGFFKKKKKKRRLLKKEKFLKI